VTTSALELPERGTTCGHHLAIRPPAALSEPAADPNNPGFIYKRFQRGIMHYDASTGATRGILLADYLKAILRSVGLPSDLRDEASGSRLFI
jgi:hypothetical protein